MAYTTGSELEVTTLPVQSLAPSFSGKRSSVAFSLVKGIAPMTKPPSSESLLFISLLKDKWASIFSCGGSCSAVPKFVPVVVVVGDDIDFIESGFASSDMATASLSGSFDDGEDGYSWRAGVDGRTPSESEMLRGIWPSWRGARKESMTRASSGGVGKAPVIKVPVCPLAELSAMPRDLKDGSCKSCRDFARWDSELVPDRCKVEGM